MIERVRVLGYRKFRELNFEPHQRLNILIGDNDAGKSTLLEAITLALTGRINGRLASDEVNPFWFNAQMVKEFFTARAEGQTLAPPVIEVEVFLYDRDEFQRNLFGANNSELPTRACAGILLRVEPDPDYGDEIEAYLAELGVDDDGPSSLPVEYYRVDWRTFSNKMLTARPKELTTAVIDSRTIRSNSGMDIHLKQILNDHLEAPDKAKVSLAVRANRDTLASPHLEAVNEKMADLPGPLDDKPLKLAMDQTGRGAWDSSVIPHVAEVPFMLSGQGQQAAIKIALAMGRTASAARVVMIEEPENHLSHTNLNKLLARIADLAGDDQQLFITTHSSYVLNRIGVDGLQLVGENGITALGALCEDTVAYFKKLPGYDTLRMALAGRLILVEGPSDEIVVERFYMDTHDGRRPIADGIDVISMRALSLKHCLRLVQALGTRCAVLRDNDGNDPAELLKDLAEYLNDDRGVFIGAFGQGNTLEPQIVYANDEKTVRTVLAITERAVLATWMDNNKTESALRILETSTTLNAPSYITEAMAFIENSG
ncbi:AAA family ATPase [Mycobacterium sp. 21AC1]|uniref:ATP-dependent nuclease n=1 Tax=[Mycobacterium] appelbergii TaxID=2939269 RepID=UPI00293940EB|nr:AAA family ATPase [Mycobacterium sp. 21AC1]MDV3125942.1 AAA family ATPase [Mycobacterium sp. 21AC1]